MNIDKIKENHQKSMNIYEHQSNSMKLNDNQLQSLKIHEDLEIEGACDREKIFQALINSYIVICFPSLHCTCKHPLPDTLPLQWDEGFLWHAPTFFATSKSSTRFPFLAKTGLCWGLLELQLAQVGLKLAHMGPLGGHMGPLGGHLGINMSQHVSSWTQLGSTWGHLHLNWAILTPK